VWASAVAVEAVAVEAVGVEAECFWALQARRFERAQKKRRAEGSLR
jgi:hypothetical protein